MRRKGLVCGLLVVATVAVYWHVCRCGFVKFDDPGYVTENPHVIQGITMANLRWAFTTGAAANWHPITWLSHMADAQLFGFKPWGHHLTNLLLHVANTLVLFLLLERMTGSMTPSAIVAGLFGLHPLHVESVAWVAERKDVLSAFFFLLTLMAYSRFAQKVEVGDLKPEDRHSRQGAAFSIRCSVFGKKWLYYAAALGFYALGLMSKPMLVTTPFVMLLLDFWPLGRFGPGPQTQSPKQEKGKAISLSGLFAEKVPFFALTVASCIITLIVQKRGGALLPSEGLGFPGRLSNAAVSWLTYLQKAVWPTKLAVFYPHPGTWPAWRIALAAAILVLISCLVIVGGGLSRRRYLMTGWAWYLGMLVPVIGLVQVGAQAWADRYSYLPLIGIFIMVGWGAREVWNSLPRLRIALLYPAAAIILAGCAIGTVHQIQFWQDSELLFSHAIAVTRDNYVAFLSRGAARMEQRRLEEAASDYMQSLRIQPECAQAHLNLGNALALQGEPDEAIIHFEKAIRLMPKYARAHYSWGLVLENMGRTDEAGDHFERAVALDPDLQEARVRLANSLFTRNRNDEAIAQYRKAVIIAPADPALHHWLASALARAKRFDEAREHFEISLKLGPDNPAALNDLAWVISVENVTNRDVVRGLALARRACELTTNREPMYLDTLAVAYSESAQFEEAIDVSQKAVAAAEQAGEIKLAARIEARLMEYRRGRSYHALSPELKK